jgi:hypothetical protein
VFSSSSGEVLALRIYTTYIYKHINWPLRDNQRRDLGYPCPLPVTTKLASGELRLYQAAIVLISNHDRHWLGFWPGAIELHENKISNKNKDAGFCTKILCLLLQFVFTDVMILYNTKKIYPPEDNCHATDGIRKLRVIRTSGQNINKPCDFWRGMLCIDVVCLTINRKI